jgi:AcrR family transcriptional regulator
LKAYAAPTSRFKRDMPTDRSTEPASSSVSPTVVTGSRQRLLEAAKALLGQKGFETTTVRDIAERAGVDAALIIRYFGSKADLYIATLLSESRGDKAFERLDQIVGALFTRADEYGVGPVTHALVRFETAPEIRAAAQAHLLRRSVAPIAADLTGRGYDRPELRAAIIAAALTGINLGRAFGWVDLLASVPKDELVELVTAMLDMNETEREKIVRNP